MNHTSDEHPWFKESRSSRDNAKADWYVWNDDDQKWPDARVVFTDVERSNWTWDDTRQQYYWHRFYHHQPDLNYENPEVADTMIDLVRFWLDLGFDGFRLDAVPYLYQRDGTSGEHLPETHAFIKRIRKQIDADYPGRILLAEANGWPSDVADYFGDGDECHLCFHFPLMPRLFMAVRREQRYPITEILAQTPVIDGACQWAIFLRNHDELTLEQVSEEERDYLIAEYAKDPRMKRHMGIGRRLAPLLDNDRRTAELLYALILSLPGSPVIYYGDELLMGDNIYLGDRDSVRTPMQWSPDRNGGFSQADFAQLYLPPLMDPVYGFTALNVEAQLRNQGSFLHWLRRMLTERRALPVMGVGEMEVLPCANPSVLAYVRSGEVADILTTPPAKGPSVGESIDDGLDWGRSTVLARTVPAGNESEADEVRAPAPGRPVRAQPQPLRPARRAGAGQVGRLHPLRGARTRPVPDHHRGAVHDHAAALRVPVVRPGARGETGTGMTDERDQALRTLTEAWLGLRQVAPRHRRPSSCAPRSCAPGARACSTSWPRWTAAWPTSSSACAAWPTNSTSCARGRRPRSACSTTRTASPSAPTRCATRTWRRCCWRRSVASSRVRGRSGCCATTTTPRVLDCGDRGDLMVFPWLADAPRPDVDVMVALEEAGFNHVAAPLVRWVWEGRDLGVVQEPLADRSGGWALALTSLRDFYASGGTPEAAGGDFGGRGARPRRHDGPDASRPRPRLPAPPRARWSTGWTRRRPPSPPRTRRCSRRPGVADLVKWLRECEVAAPGGAHPRRPATRSGRRGRTRGGWSATAARAACCAGETAPGRRSPLADVADMLWSFHRASIDRGGRARPGGPARARATRAGVGDAEPPGLHERVPQHAGHRRAGGPGPRPGPAAGVVPGAGPLGGSGGGAAGRPPKAKAGLARP